MSYTELGEIVSEIARGLDRPRPGARRSRRAAVHDPRRVDLRGLRDHRRRRASSSRSTPPTPPRSARGSRATRSRASSSARTRARWRRSSPSATSCPSSRRSSRSSPADGAISLDELRERGRGRDPREVAERTRGRQARGPVHDHLHVGHDRAAEGLRAHARQLPPGHPHVRGDRRHRGGRGRLPLPAARALLRAADPAAGRRSRRAARLLERRPAADRARPDGHQAGLPAVGAAHLREDLHARHLQQRPGEDRGRDRSSG